MSEGSASGDPPSPSPVPDEPLSTGVKLAYAGPTFALAGMAIPIFVYMGKFYADVVLVPIGGGGLASGSCLAASGLRPDLEVWGAEPAGADDAFRSLRDGRQRPLPFSDRQAGRLPLGQSRFVSTIHLLNYRITTTNQGNLIHGPASGYVHTWIMPHLLMKILSNDIFHGIAW